jgi:hypothetical protein
MGVLFSRCKGDDGICDTEQSDSSFLSSYNKQLLNYEINNKDKKVTKPPFNEYDHYADIDSYSKIQNTIPSAPSENIVAYNQYYKKPDSDSESVFKFDSNSINEIPSAPTENMIAYKEHYNTKKLDMKQVSTKSSAPSRENMTDVDIDVYLDLETGFENDSVEPSAPIWQNL